MNKVRLGLLGLLMLLVLSSARADDFPVTGSGASGRPGDRVYVNLTYNYGASFSAIAEDLDIQYAAIGLSGRYGSRRCRAPGIQTVAARRRMRLPSCDCSRPARR